MTAHQNNALLETIVSLAEEIARTSPECANKAVKIVELVGELDARSLDRAAMEDALTVETADSDISDLRLRATTEAVLKAAREP
jgi:hypothetical protein